MLVPPGELASPPRGNPGSATAKDNKKHYAETDHGFLVERGHQTLGSEGGKPKYC